MPRQPDDVRSPGQSRYPAARPRLPFLTDAVEKVPNCFATNFPPKDESRDNCSSICPQASFRSHWRIHRFMKTSAASAARQLHRSSRNRNDAQIVGRSCLAERYTGNDYQQISGSSELLLNCECGCTLNHFLVAVNVLGKDAMSAPKQAQTTGYLWVWRDRQYR